jgi:hypothetical protein
MTIAILLVSFIVGAQGQQEIRFALLPASETASLAREYPKSGPDKIDGGWQPNKAVIDNLEANLPHISELRSFGAPNGEKIEHPNTYFRQYLAVIRGGQRKIYVNAMCDVKYSKDWRTHLAIVMDGGSCFWQAWFDPATEKFTDFYINGRA